MTQIIQLINHIFNRFLNAIIAGTIRFFCLLLYLHIYSRCHHYTIFFMVQNRSCTIFSGFICSKWDIYLYIQSICENWQLLPTCMYYTYTYIWTMVSSKKSINMNLKKKSAYILQYFDDIKMKSLYFTSASKYIKKWRKIILVIY